MPRRPREESLDRLVAACLAVGALIQLWTTNDIPGPRWATVPLTLAITASVAVRRRWPLAVGCLVLAGFLALLFAGGAQTQQGVPVAIAWMCGIYALAVWTDTREFL